MLTPNERAARTLLVGALVLGMSYFLLAPFVHFVGLFFAGALLAVALGSVAAWIAKHTGLPQGAALGLVLAGIVGAWVGFGTWLGANVGDQFAELAEAVPSGIRQGRAWLEGSELGRVVIERIDSASDASDGSVARAFVSVSHSLLTGVDIAGEVLVLVLFGVFLAAAPQAYVNGALLLLPKHRRPRTREVLDTIARALRLWLLARLSLMCFVGTAFGLGLWLIGVPLALPLGVLAGALGFIPFVGPTLAFIPAVAVGLLQSPQAALHVTILYLAIQFVEGNLLEPVVEARTVSLKPALILLGQVATAVWFGALGVLIATPLVVVIVVVVQMLYLEDRLGEEVKVIGRRAPAKPREGPLPEPSPVTG